MSNYSKQSSSNLSECHADLQTLFNIIIKNWDNTIITGRRNKKEQNKKFAKKLSKVQWPNSKHNQTPSMAVDSVPYPTLYTDRENMIAYSGYVLGIAQMLYDYGAMDHKIRCGFDWNQNDRLDDENWLDIGHFEIML